MSLWTALIVSSQFKNGKPSKIWGPATNWGGAWPLAPAYVEPCLATPLPKGDGDQRPRNFWDSYTHLNGLTYSDEIWCGKTCGCF